MEASRKFERIEGESEDLSRFEDSLSDLDLRVFMEGVEEKDSSDAETKTHGKSEDITPERVKQAWDQLSDTEKRFVVSSQKVFDSVLLKYEQQVGSQKAKILSALRKLILSHDHRAGLIDLKESV